MKAFTSLAHSLQLAPLVWIVAPINDILLHKLQRLSAMNPRVDRSKHTRIDSINACLPSACLAPKLHVPKPQRKAMCDSAVPLDIWPRSAALVQALSNPPEFHFSYTGLVWHHFRCCGCQDPTRSTSLTGLALPKQHLAQNCR